MSARVGCKKVSEIKEVTMNMLQGKKTYSIVVAGILAAIAGYLSGELTVAQLVEAVLIALGFATLRHGVSTDGVKPPRTQR